MTTAKRRRTSGPTMTIETVVNNYGLAEPSIRIDLGAGATSRQTKAAMHLVAARVELLSVGASWCVQTRDHGFCEHKGRVYLELASATAEECERGLGVLRAVVERDASAVLAVRAGT
ncbi:MAG: hypothetical protein K8T90_07485 [Planctomycetes bacterium]|nr:hypothetical protein [Planctomycetota bacterium]